MHRKVWVKRPNATATQVTINEDDLVDDVKDMILRKYTNSLGRNFDSPDVMLKVIQREHHGRRSVSEQVLAPEDNMIRTLEHHFPGGQKINEALVVDVPRLTPRHSPHMAMPYYIADQARPVENGTGYFPPMPLVGPQSPNLPSNVSLSSGQTGHVHRPPQHPHSISVLETGHVPDLPSPSTRLVRHSVRPRMARQHTSSPTVVSGNSHSSGSHENHVKVINAQAHTMPPILPEIKTRRSSTPPPRPASPRPKAIKKAKKPVEIAPASGGILDGAVPPINVLIVEDNMINLKLLEAFLKRLKVRWKTAMNGRDAVSTWRQGGFHLVVMDIQMPVMNGLDATKEIRRLERVNNIGVFSNEAGSIPSFSDGADPTGPGEAPGEEGKDEDILANTDLFKSPVIIVALTASSLQSDRHEALAAGCNDFLTKPVSFDWLSRKVMEWGCMQALIDFDGWRKWKDFTPPKPPDPTPKKVSAAVISTSSPPPPPPSSSSIKSPKRVTGSPLANGKVKAAMTTSSAVGIGAGGGGDGGEVVSDGTDTNGEEGSGNEVLVNA